MERIVLRGFQQEISNEIIKRFNSETYNRYAAVVVPTGGGKTYNELDLISIFQNPDFKSKRCCDEGITNQRILSLSPSKEINNRKKEALLKHFIFNIPDEEMKSVDSIIKFITNNYGKDGNPFYGFKRKEFKQKVTDESSREEKLNAILQCIDSKYKTYLIKRAFPGLKFACYSGLKGILKDKSNKFDLISVDEAHQAVAKEWVKDIKKLVRVQNPTAKVVSFTATPDREDEINSMKLLASIIYGKEVPEKYYLIKDIRLKQAMETGIVIAANSVHSKSGLIKKYKEALSIYLELINLTPNIGVNASDRKALKQVETSLKKMGKILFTSEDEKDILDEFSDEIKQLKEFARGTEYGINTEELFSKMCKRIDEVKAKLIAKTFSNTIKEKNAKCIIFIPAFNNSFKSYEDYDKYYKEYIEGLFSDTENKLKCNVNVQIVSSRYKDNENSEKINNFENSTDTNTIQVLVSVQYLDAGIHIEGINYCIHLVSTNSAIRKQQRDGRVISATDPDKEFKDQHKRTVIDCAGNFITQHIKGTSYKRSLSYDLEQAIKLKNWMIENGRIPDINSKNENEARKAFIFKILQELYKAYNTGEKSTEDKNQNEYISEILSTLNQIPVENFWEYQFPQRTRKPTEEEMIGLNFYKLDKFEEAFLQEYNNILTLTPREIDRNNRLNRENFDNLIKMIEIIIKRKPQIKLPADIKIMGQAGGYKSKEYKNVTNLKGFLEKHFNESEVQEVIDEIIDETNLIDVEEFDFLGFLSRVRGCIWSPLTNYRNTLFYDKGELRYPMEKIVNCGIFGYKRVDQEEYFRAFERATETSGKALYFTIKHNSGGYIKKGPDYLGGERKSTNQIGLLRDFQNTNLRTGILYTNGYDREGNDKFGFNKNGIHRDTGTKYNKRGFYRKGNKYINKLTNTEFDMLGYDIRDLDRNQNNRQVRKDTFKKVLYKGKEYWINEETSDIYDKEGNDKFGFNEEGINKVTGKLTNERQFYYDKEKGEYLNKLTGSKFDALGFDIEDLGIDENGNKIIRPESGHNFVKVKLNGVYVWIHEDTSDYFDENGYDNFSFYRNNINSKTGTKKNIRGYYVKKSGTMRKYYNSFTRSEVDVFGYNIADEKIIDEDGHIEKRPEPKDKFVKIKCHDGKVRWIHDKTSNIYNLKGFNYERINVRTNSKYNERGFYLTAQGEYYHRLTRTKYDPFGFDINERNKDGRTRPVNFYPEFKKITLENGTDIWVNEATSQEFDLEGNIYDDSIKIYKAPKGTKNRRPKNGIGVRCAYSIERFSGFIDTLLKTDISVYENSDEVKVNIAKKTPEIYRMFRQSNGNDIRSYINTEVSECFRILRSINCDAEIINKLVVKLTSHIATRKTEDDRKDAVEKIGFLIKMFPTFRKIIEENTEELRLYVIRKARTSEIPQINSKIETNEKLMNTIRESDELKIR